MRLTRSITAVLSVVLVGGTMSCGMLSTPPTERERDAAFGGLAGGAVGAIIGSFTGSAVAGGLFGIPIGAVAGYYIGDQLARADEDSRTRMNERDREIDRLRRENERLRKQTEDIRPGAAPSSAPTGRTSAGSEQIREAQRALNNMGYDSGPVNGEWNAQTQAAVRDFQQTRGLEVTGQLNERTLQGLGVQTGTASAQRAGS